MYCVVPLRKEYYRRVKDLYMTTTQRFSTSQKNITLLKIDKWRSYAVVDEEMQPPSTNTNQVTCYVYWMVNVETVLYRCKRSSCYLEPGNTHYGVYVKVYPLCVFNLSLQHFDILDTSAFNSLAHSTIESNVSIKMSFL